jgi:hypothetical protein
MGFLPELATAAQPLDGPAVAMMQGLARELGPYPRSLDTGLDYASDGSVAAVSLWQAVS